ncbi:probable mitochondrial saccharopine dehydrogenase-like oxidoreductase At5g39410 isoform X2 [Chenopodium quinoa]|uniref:probable mitochondrial saccharopine dehydrogenase-like oxidoreductase At5g39410 isoform X2 n=1 Tax=Chenopodium quinoa TaxID=63459 RepID=UPI000B78D630|nr:probable mitochondrial saccharopine dehydrogenase-like oxidoreductase At5g39410 isoform X2 [Chenopodium quinoa]
MAAETHLSTPPPYDIIILGASGFTGKYVLKESLKFLNSSSSSSPLKSLAIASRNPTKLAQSLSWASHPNPPPNITILTAHTLNFDSLLHIASLTKLILNCVGPFRLHGDPVVRACLETRTDYLDICGEPEFMEKMEVQYHDQAFDKGCLVVSACGFDSVPAELGLLFNSRQWVSPSAPNTVEAYLSLESDKRIVGNFATYESAVLGVANADSLRLLRRSRPKKARPQITGPPPRGSTIEQQKEVGLWAVRLPSADSAVVQRTLAILTQNPSGLRGVNESADKIAERETFWSTVKPAHFGVKIGTKSLLGISKFITVGVFIGLLGKFSFGRWLLLKFPSVFSLGGFRKQGPTEAEVSNASFKMWFVGHGFSDSSTASLENKKPDTEIITTVMGPEIGYVTTPIILVQCALITLNQRQNLPKGGVLTPGIVFGPTDLQERLQQNGISFNLISKRALSLPQNEILASNL